MNAKIFYISFITRGVGNTPPKSIEKLSNTSIALRRVIPRHVVNKMETVTDYTILCPRKPSLTSLLSQLTLCTDPPLRFCILSESAVWPSLSRRALSVHVSAALCGCPPPLSPASRGCRRFQYCKRAIVLQRPNI